MLGIDRLKGFPLDFFPVLFAVPRVVGWLAHWRQARSYTTNTRIGPDLARR
jgi:citrate synthase